MAFVKTTVINEGHSQEMIVEVPEHEAPSWSNKSDFKIIGKPTPRIEGVDRITGKAIYAFDVQLPGMLIGKILRSPYPHAKIKSIDASQAMKVQGVIAVLHSQNSNNIPVGTDFMFNPEVHYVGDDVAVVIAETERAAKDGRALIKVEYEVLPFVVDKMTAVAANAPKVQSTGNIVGGKPVVKSRGNIDAGFLAADLVIEQTYTVPNVHHTTLETHGSVAAWDGDELTVYDSTQSVYLTQAGLAGTFRMPTDKVRVIMNFMGGGFGSKTGLGKYTLIAAVAAKQTGRPVKIFLDRDEEFLATGHRSADIQKIKVGVKKDGPITALKLEAYVDSGAFAGRFLDVGTPVRELYKCPNVMTTMIGVFLNTATQSPMRGPGSTEGMYPLECVMDKIATELNMDPLELRMKNYTELGNQEKSIPYSSKGLKEAFEYGAAKIDWKNKRNAKPGQGSGNIRHGVGVGSLMWGAGGGRPSSVDIFVNSDGSATVRTAVNDLGQGAMTTMAMIAAETLGIPIAKVNVSAADTKASSYDLGSFGSRVTSSLGPAVHNAAYDAVIQIGGAAAVMLNIAAEQVQFENGVYFKPGDQANGVPITDALKKFSRPVVGNGFRGPNPPNYVSDSFGAQFAEVEVNTDTGEVKILNFVAAHDAGRVINPLTIESQLYGAVALGIGYGLYEGQVIDPGTGIPVTTDFVSYKITSYADYRPVDPYLVPQIDPANNINVKGFAEPPCMPTAPAIANAVYNAIGVQITDLPITPARVLKALAQAKTQK